jgi:NADH-quinone oxidoreductase subunit M
MPDAAWWLAGILALPAMVIGVSRLPGDVERVRRLSVALASVMVMATLAIPLFPTLREFSVQTSVLAWRVEAEELIRVDALSAALLPFAAGLWLLTVAVTPRAALDRRGLRRTAFATLLTVASFLTESAVALLVLSAISLWAFVAGIAHPSHHHQRRVVAVYLGLSTLLFAAGVGLVAAPGTRGTGLETAAMWLIVIAALIRKGIVPFHAWVPEVFDHGRLGPAILFNAPQVGAYMTVVLIVPHASPAMLRVIALLALGTAVYGAALALVQRSARRSCGYLFMSQSALVMAGLDCTSVTALAGGLLVWLSAGLAFGGLARAVLVLEARRGRLDLTAYHGGYERMPVLAVSFLAMGLACTGFPGTLGFLGQELLVSGAVLEFPVMGFAVVVASALTGLAVLRMYFSLFCGRAEVRASTGLQLGLRPREAWTFVALVVTLVALGLLPRPLVDSRFAASEAILRERAANQVLPARKDHQPRPEQHEIGVGPQNAAGPEELRPAGAPRVVMDADFPERRAGALGFLDEFGADRPAVARETDAVEDGPANQAEVAVHVRDRQPEQPPREELVQVAGKDAVAGIVARHLHPVDEVDVGREQHQEQGHFLHVVLAVAVRVEDQVLGRGGKPRTQRPAVAAVRLMGNDLQPADARLQIPQHVRAAVGGSVVDDDDLGVVGDAAQRAVGLEHELADGLGVVVAGKKDGNARPRHRAGGL